MSGFTCAKCGTLLMAYPCGVCNHGDAATLAQQAGKRSLHRVGLRATSAIVPAVRACQLVVE